MKLAEQQNAAVLRMAGRLPMRRLVLTPGEIATLAKARKICEDAADALGETAANEGAFLDAEARLAEILT